MSDTFKDVPEFFEVRICMGRDFVECPLIFLNQTERDEALNARTEMLSTLSSGFPCLSLTDLQYQPHSVSWGLQTCVM